MECVLCDIRFSHRDSQLIYEDENVFVMMNIEPVKDGHVMILPVRHVKDLRDLTAQEASAFTNACDRAMSFIEKMFHEEGPMLIVNGWKFRSQEHLHAHVLPSKGGLRQLFVAAEGTSERVRVERDVLREKIEQIRPHF